MKILQVIPSYWPATQFGGTIFSSHNLNKALVRRGVDLTVYTTHVGLEVKVAVDTETIVDGVKVRYFGFNKFFESFGPTGWQFSMPLTHALNENVKDFDIVYIVSVWNYPTTIAAQICRRIGKPYIMSPHGVLYPYTMRKKSWKKWLYYHLFIKTNLRSASAVHYTTKDEARQCHPFLGLNNRPVVVPNGIDLQEFSALPPKGDLVKRFPVLRDKKVVLFLGRINWKKGLDILISAFARIARENTDVHLLIVGNDEEGYRKKVEQWISGSGITDKVTFAGSLGGADRLRAYSGSDIFVLPSYSENFGMTVVEAMACGLPVVISDQVGLYEEVKDSGSGIVVKTDADDVYRGIMELLGNAGAMKMCAENGKKLVKEFYDVEKVASAMIDEFQKEIKKASE
jgi:glycosyltransferase involved in cell wall biosynthesis